VYSTFRSSSQTALTQLYQRTFPMALNDVSDEDEIEVIKPTSSMPGSQRAASSGAPRWIQQTQRHAPPHATTSTHAVSKKRIAPFGSKTLPCKKKIMLSKLERVPKKETSDDDESQGETDGDEDDEEEFTEEDSDDSEGSEESDDGEDSEDGEEDDEDGEDSEDSEDNEDSDDSDRIEDVLHSGDREVKDEREHNKGANAPTITAPKYRNEQQRLTFDDAYDGTSKDVLDTERQECLHRVFRMLSDASQRSKMPLVDVGDCLGALARAVHEEISTPTHSAYALLGKVVRDLLDTVVACAVNNERAADDNTSTSTTTIEKNAVASFVESQLQSTWHACEEMEEKLCSIKAYITSVTNTTNGRGTSP